MPFGNDNRFILHRFSNRAGFPLYKIERNMLTWRYCYLERRLPNLGRRRFADVMPVPGPGGCAERILELAVAR
jgi:hypothetical protein